MKYWFLTMVVLLVSAVARAHEHAAESPAVSGTVALDVFTQNDVLDLLVVDSVEGFPRLKHSRTRDGGKSFDVLNKGLPPAPCYDLVYRHGLDVNESGDLLVMGSTTGALWISEDQGDRWSQVPARLPPVYAVAFA